jgi:tRNA(His) 5'-end guanylyltransferase
MIVGSIFEGDNNNEIMMIQHHQYQINVSKMVFNVQSFYKNTTELAQFGKDNRTDNLHFTSFDHRRFQLYHDIIAGYFRFQQNKSLEQTLFRNNEKNLDVIKNEWQIFWANEIEELTNNKNWSRAILFLAVSSDQNKIDNLQTQLLSLLKIRYKDFYNCIYFKNEV